MMSNNNKKNVTVCVCIGGSKVGVDSGSFSNPKGTILQKQSTRGKRVNPKTFRRIVQYTTSERRMPTLRRSFGYLVRYITLTGRS